jgi:uncharacterized protein
MTQAIDRRHLLKFISGATLLPLSSAIATAAELTGAKHPLSVKGVRFSSMAAPDLSMAAKMATTTVESVMTVAYSDGSHVDFDLAYEPFFNTGAMVPNGHGGTTLAGGYYDIHGRAIMDESGASPRQFYSDGPDGTSLLALNQKTTVSGIQGNAVYAVVQFEYTTRNMAGVEDGMQTSKATKAEHGMYGKLPSPIAVLTLDQNPNTGKLTLKKYSTVDTSAVHGLWITCGASLSPWNTHLSSEEYEPDARTIAKNKQFHAYIQNLYGDEQASNDPHKANPYLYGHLPEVTVHANGTGTITKHYCMGRISHELVEVMPDQRTVLMGDDATNSAYFMFIADTAKNLSAGTLYVAQLNSPLVSVDPAAAPTSLTWIKLGHATSAEVASLAKKLTFNDIMDVVSTDPSDSTYTQIYIGGVAEWAKVKPGMEKAAAFLETHRYAAIKGGSMGFSKMEGTTLNAADKILYSALSYCKDSMVASSSKHDPKSNVNLPKALNAGAVMGLKLVSGAVDVDKKIIRSDWVPSTLQSVLIGQDQAPDALGNTAHADKIANPDNLKFSEKMRTLFIGEDSGMHVNNFLWAYNVDTQQLSRILSCPAGAESTGLHAVDAIKGWTYVMSNFQHAGDWEPIHQVVQPVLDPLIRANYSDRYSAAVGYLTCAPQQMSLGKA